MDTQPPRALDLLGAVVANAYNLLVIGLFAARMAGRPAMAYWLGVLSLCSIVPLAYLLVAARSGGRPFIYFVWVALMIFFQLVELVVDYLFKVEFRSIRWATIIYVMLFFGATGGMIGLASQAGRAWAGVTVVTFLAMAAMAFIQRAKTGL